MSVAITPELIAQHQLTPGRVPKIVDILGREPSYTELGIFSVMWSEHCSYKSSRLHLKKLPTRGKLVVQGPGENAGIIDIGGGYVIAFKIESHNHPSFIEPFQGAATGVGGILRDIFTMGARPIAVMDSLRFGRLDDPQTGARNRRILSGVVAGIAHYGNCFGVPTVGGECIFEPCYDGNPLVNVFALGVCRKEDVFYAKAAGVGNPVIYVGARTGRDGIHGASMASAEFTEESKQKRPNVQVGDPFMEKLLLEACIEAMQTGAIVGIQDMGAAGLTCSTCEMGSRGEVGIEIELDRVPQRETGMTPYEIMLSESQERMLLVADKGREEEVFRVFRKWGLEAVEIGVVTGDGKLRVRQHGEMVAEIPNRELADEAPLYDRRIHRAADDRRPDARTAWKLPPKATCRTPAGAAGRARHLLQALDLGAVRLPGPHQHHRRPRSANRRRHLRIKETGTSVAMSLDGNGRYCYLSPREGAQLAVAECCRNLSTVGAQPVAATNCLNFGNPERPGDHGATRGSHRRHGGSLPLLRHAHHRRQRQPVQRNPGRRHLPHARDGHRRPAEDRRAGHHSVQNAGRSVMLLGGIGDLRRDALRRHRVRQGILKQLWGLPPALDLDTRSACRLPCAKLWPRGWPNRRTI
jgi:phosphoribosylformylglycinamidine (FGAM) synthase-like enzyme